jgi:O-antigen ligase
VGLAFVFALGILLLPPTIPKWRPWMFWTFFGVAGLLLFKEFAPYTLFTSPRWRELLSGSYNVAFLPTHHPEPARAFDTLLVLVIAAVWFVWVRTLTARHDTSVAWLLLTSAAVTSSVWLVLGHSDSSLIYGYRDTPGWFGFGPFPNRNHTASFLAMGTLIGCGCTVRAAMHRRWLLLFAGCAMIGVTGLALLESRSRGGLVALAIGLGIFLALAIFRTRNRKSIVLGLAALLASAAMLMAFGGGVIARFTAVGEGDIPSNVRWDIWRDTLGAWRDAPVFGHGISTFEGIFPLYQKVDLVSQYVLHPESSWLLWLFELGSLLTGVAALALLLFLGVGLRFTLKHPRNYYVRIGAFAAIGALLCHSLWDVPAHRWGTAGFALAALALACPPRGKGGTWHPGKALALAPIAIAVFWGMPFLNGIPPASPTSLTRLLIENATSQRVSMEELEGELRQFPLSFQLHVAIALRKIAIPGKQHEAWSHFRTALRLRPGSWALAATAAKAASRVSPGMTLHFWSVTVERAGHRAGEMLNFAHRETLQYTIADGFWDRFVEAHPHLLLDYALILPDDEGQYFFDTWMAQRSSLPDLSDAEVRSFHNALRRYGRLADLQKWMAEQPSREEEDFKIWAAMLHSGGEDRDAWSLLANHVSEPGFGARSPSTPPLALLETRWRWRPQDFVNVVAYAQALAEQGAIDESEAVIAKAAEDPNAPPWLLQRAAFVAARNEDYSRAVELLLRGLGGA